MNDQPEPTDPVSIRQRLKTLQSQLCRIFEDSRQPDGRYDFQRFAQGNVVG